MTAVPAPVDPCVDILAGPCAPGSGGLAVLALAIARESTMSRSTVLVAILVLVALLGAFLMCVARVEVTPHLSDAALHPGPGVIWTASDEADRDRQELLAIDAEPVSEVAEELTPVADAPAEATTTPEPEPWVARFKRVEVPVATFEAKYAGKTPEELKRAQDDVLTRLQELRHTAFEERYASGQFARRPHVANAWPGIEKPGFSVKASSDDQLVQLRTGSPGETNVVWLPFEDYPEIYNLKDEWGWVASKVGQYEIAQKKK